MTKQMAQAAQLLADGRDTDFIIHACFDLLAADGVSEDAEKVRRAKAKLREWQRHPVFQDHYRQIIRSVMFPAYSRAVNRLNTQIDDPNQWIAQGAAREVITRFGPDLMGQSDTTITIKVEGMPELGVPDQDE